MLTDQAYFNSTFYVTQYCKQGACVFISGSSKRMPADVRKALLQVLQEHGGMHAEESEQFLNRLARQKRYIVEAWS